MESTFVALDGGFCRSWLHSAFRIVLYFGWICISSHSALGFALLSIGLNLFLVAFWVGLCLVSRLVQPTVSSSTELHSGLDGWFGHRQLCIVEIILWPGGPIAIDVTSASLEKLYLHCG